MQFNNAQDGARRLSVDITALISATVCEGFTSIYDVIPLDPKFLFIQPAPQGAQFLPGGDPNLQS